MARAAADLPLAWPAWRHADVLGASRTSPLGLAAGQKGEREAFMVSVADAVRAAKKVGCSRIILEPGVVALSGEDGDTDLLDPSVGWTPDRAKAQFARRKTALNKALDQACRNLFDLLRTWDDVTFCLTPGRHVASIGDLSGLQALFEDRRDPRLAYWHDAAIAARRAELLGEDQGAWLEENAKVMQGMTLGDSADGQGYLPPGAGAVDHGLLSSYVPRTTGPLPVVLELQPAVDSAELAGAIAFLDKFDL